ncbi:AzlC family ABC transporter permease [Acinetobacter nectaris]|uniref:AzlC family ABC transporter permease n=1 Tax=Acinetobacter nectaris TaxID=1219382 RepID=UPI0004245F5B|nr:AzlC family ABC transporter permease [Acinetobacter nectaris]
MSENQQNIYRLSASDTLFGFKQLLPISIFVAIFGGAFGLAASQTNIDHTATVLMSASVFAGASQFATLELWKGSHIPFFSLFITVFFINARHILMGASLYPWLKHLSPLKRYAILLVISDANWASSFQAFNQQKPGIGLLFGGGLALWVFWVLGTVLGIYFGYMIHNPYALGLDMVMACFLLTMVVGGQKNMRVFTIWATAAISSLLAYLYLPKNSHVVVGAFVGGIVGFLWKSEK